MNLIKSAALIVAISLSINFSVKSNENEVSSSRVLFESATKVFSRYDMIAGPLIYQEEDSDQYSQGFRARSTVAIEGMYERLIYDYSENHTAIAIKRMLTELLMAEGFSIEYACEGLDCGDIAAWKLFLGRHIAGIASKQHYVAAYLGDIKNPMAVKAAHITEFDGQPRLIIDTVYHSRPPVNSQLTRTSLLDRWLNDGSLEYLGEVYFSSSSNALSKQSQLNQVAQKFIGKIQPSSNLLLLGYADQRGDALSNSRLSQTRAESVKAELLRNTGIAENLITTYGLGELSGPHSEARKVKVYLVN